MIDPATLKIETAMTDERPSLEEAQKGREASEAFKEAVERVVERAKEEITEKFEKPLDTGNNLAYHRLWHTEDVMRRTHVLLEAMGADGQTLLLGKLAAAAHDIVQDWDEVRDTITLQTDTGEVAEAPRVKLVRRFGKNEEASANWTAEVMEGINAEAGEEIFTEEDMQIVKEAVQTTIPSFDGPRVIQQNLGEGSHIIATAVALADLGETGIGSPGVFIEGSNALFREENLDIARDIRSRKPIPDGKKEQYRLRMLAWIGDGIAFAGGRKATFNNMDILAVPEENRERVKGLFIHFDEITQRMGDIYTAARKMSFEELAKFMGYEAA